MRTGGVITMKDAFDIYVQDMFFSPQAPTRFLRIYGALSRPLGQKNSSCLRPSESFWPWGVLRAPYILRKLGGALWEKNISTRTLRQLVFIYVHTASTRCILKFVSTVSFVSVWIRKVFTLVPGCLRKQVEYVCVCVCICISDWQLLPTTNKQNRPSLVAVFLLQIINSKNDSFSTHLCTF